MPTYACALRTNYFRVKDEAAFLALMSRAYPSVIVFDREEDGVKFFGFGTYDGIAGLKNAVADEDDDADEANYDEFISELQKCVAADDAIIILESGHEKLRYVTGIAEIITANAYKAVHIQEIAAQVAAQMLGQPSWTTRCEY